MVEQRSSLYRLLEGEDQVGSDAAAAHLRTGSSGDQSTNGACRCKRLAFGEHVPDGGRQLAGELDACDRRPTLTTQPAPGALVVTPVAGMAGGVGGGGGDV